MGRAAFGRSGPSLPTGWGPRHKIELPVPIVTSCGFGGDDLKDLYITTAISDGSGPTTQGVFFAINLGSPERQLRGMRVR